MAEHADGDLDAAPTLVTARTFVLPVDEDMFFPVRDCRPGQEKVPNSDLLVLEEVRGHMTLFGTADTFKPQIDRHLKELLASPA